MERLIMNYSRTIRNMAESIINHYGSFDPYDKCHNLDIHDVPEFDLHEIAAQMMRDDSSLACEATGSDNPAYKTKMLPALINFMSDSSSKDERIEFVHEWRDGVLSYFKDPISELLNDCRYQRNCEDSFNQKTQQQIFNEARL